MKKYTIGIDYGTLSGRALLLDAESGEVVATSVLEYAHGVMDRELPDGTPLPPQFALQHPADYIEVLHTAVPNVLCQSGVDPRDVVGIGIDFTTCTLIPVDENCKPLCFHSKYKNEPHAYVKLWKHHGAQAEADRVIEIATERGESWLAGYGGRVSSEWAVPKIMEILNKAPEVFADTARFYDAGDWISTVLTGEENHSAGFAGFKFMWGADRGFPSDEFFRALDPRLEGLVGTKLCPHIRTVEEKAGRLSARGAMLTGLCEGIPVALSILDAEAAMPALNITEPGILMLIIGTSGVQLIHSKEKLDIPGICGFVYDGVIPGLYTYEAGQAGLGDGFDWFVRNCVPEIYTVAARESGMSIHKYLRQKAKALRVGESGLLALDWLNGNRSVLQDADLSCAIVGLTIGTRPEAIYRALIESTAFGMRRILEAYTANGLPVLQLRASGGIAKKDEMLMQIYADVTNREIDVVDTEQGAAHGSAIYAAVAAGLYPSIVEASDRLSVKQTVTYRPIPENVAAYEKLYADYCRLYDYFGRGENDVMKRLRRAGV